MRLFVRKPWAARFLYLIILMIPMAIGGLLQGCITKKASPLPVFGEREVIGMDTVYHTISNFNL